MTHLGLAGVCPDMANPLAALPRRVAMLHSFMGPAAAMHTFGAPRVGRAEVAALSFFSLSPTNTNLYYKKRNGKEIKKRNNLTYKSIIN